MLRLDEEVDMKKVKFYFMSSDGGFPLTSSVHKDLKLIQEKLLKSFEKAFGVQPKKADLPEMYHSLMIWSNAMASEKKAPPFAAELAELNGQINPWVHFVRWCFGLSPHTLPALGLAALEKFVRTDTEMHIKFIKMGERLQEDLNNLLGDDGVLIYPSHSTPAPYHGQPIVKTFNFAYTAIFNILGNPVTQVPLGLGSAGLPVGLQVVAGLHMDHLAIAVAKEAERMFGGWVPPSSLN